MSSRRYLDLYATVLLTGLTASLVIAFPDWQSSLRTALGLVVVLLAPGYVMMLALFPGRDDVDPVERLALTLGLSIAAVPPIGLILDALPWGIRLAPIAIAFTLWVGLFAILAGLRRRRAADTAFELPWGTRSFWQGTGLFAAVMVVLLGVPALAVALRPDERYTEFYVLGAGGQLQDYPRELEPGEPFELTFGIGNFEEEPLSYEVRVPFDPSYASYATPTIPAGQRWEQSLELTAPEGSGRTQLDFELWRADNKDEPYRMLHLFVTLPGPTVIPGLDEEDFVPLTPLDSDEPREIQQSTTEVTTPSESEPLFFLESGDLEPMVASEAEMRLHRVTEGETLYGIATLYLGDGDRYVELFELNSDVIENPRRVPAGVELRIPVEQ